MKKQTTKQAARKRIIRFTGTRWLILLAVVSVLVFAGIRLIGNSNAAPANFVYRDGKQLMLNGQPYRFIGMNAFTLTGCGAAGQVPNDAQMDAFMAGLQDYSMVRIWAFRNLEGSIDKVVQSAARNNIKLVMTLADGRSHCAEYDGYKGSDGSGKQASWYTSGYKTNYIPWIKKMAERYKNSSAIGMWELINEPGDADNTAYKNFFNDSAAQIKAIDPNHLISTGAWAPWAYGGESGTRDLHSGPNIDVVSVHEYDYDYNNSRTIVSPHVITSINVGNSLNKPVMVGETGIVAGDGCWTSKAVRRDALKQKFDQYMSKGVAGTLIWNWFANSPGGCNHSFGPGDPSLDMINSYKIAGAVTPSPSTPDTTAPTVTITNPVNSSTVFGSAQVSGSANDNNGITKVELYIDGNLGGSGTAMSFNFPWDTTKATVGAHTVEVRAYDAAGNMGKASVSVTVRAQSPSDPVMINDTAMGIAYSGTWNTSTGSEKYQSDDRYSTEAGAYVTIPFTGTTIRYIGSKAPHHGIAAVSIDGGPETMVDLYSASRADQAVVYTSPTLASGSHTLKIRVTGNKNAASTGTVVTLDALEYANAGTPASAPGDANGDGRVNALDLSILISRDGQNYPAADFNKDGTVGSADLAILIGKWTW